MGAYAGVEQNSPDLIVNSVVSYPLLLQRVEWGRSLLLVEHICICLLLSKTGLLRKHKYREEGGEGLELTDRMSLN